MVLTSNGPAETEEIGFRLGRLLKPGNVVCLYGDLGSGKTVFVKGIARARDIDSRDVISASFTIIAEYGGEHPFYHIDLYRVRDGNDLFETGFWDCVRSDAISVIEWADRLGDETLPGMIRVAISVDDSGRRTINIEADNEENWDNLQERT